MNNNDDSGEKQVAQVLLIFSSLSFISTFSVIIKYLCSSKKTVELHLVAILCLFDFLFSLISIYISSGYFLINSGNSLY